MIRTLLHTFFVGVVCVLAVACGGGRGDTPPLKEVEHAKSGDLNVVLLAASDALKPGKDQAFIEFRSASNQLVDVGTVTMNATMPMAGMPPMMGSSFVKNTNTTGRYLIDTDLSMAGTWRFEIAWDGPVGKGRVTLPGTVR